jgi:hypothetical protein
MGLQGFLGAYASKKLIIDVDCNKTLIGCFETEREGWSSGLRSLKRASVCGGIRRSPGAQSPDNLIKRDLKRSQFIGSINMDSLFIARTSDIATGVEVRLPFVRIGAEELKMASSRNWDGNFSDLGRRQTNLDGAVVCKLSNKISINPSILTWLFGG